MNAGDKSPRASRALLLGGLAALSGLSVLPASAQDAAALDRGRAVYEYWCAPCHAAGPGHPGTQSLELKYNGSVPAVLMERSDLTPETIKVFVRQGVLLMAPFRKTEITDAELDDLAAYLAKKK